MFIRLKSILSQPNIALDLGTANTRLYASCAGTISEKPSIVRHADPGADACCSDEYVSYLNSRLVTMPLRGGVIVDVKKTVSLLKPLVKASGKGLRRPTSLACAPTDTSDRERELLTQAVLQAGASHVAIIPEVWAAAIGAGIDVTLPSAQVLIDIGEGVTDMAVIRDGHLIFASAVRTACSNLQKAVRTAIVTKHKVNLFPSETERLTHELSSISRDRASWDKLIPVHGMDILKKRNVMVKVNSRDVIHAMEPSVNKILAMIEGGITSLPDRIRREITESGIWLTGGGACIDGMDRLVALRIHVDVRIASDPMHSVINGAIQTLSRWKEKEAWWENVVWPKVSRIK